MQEAGWYQDPTGLCIQRYWDGTAWTDHVDRRLGVMIVASIGTPSPNGHVFPELDADLQCVLDPEEVALWSGTGRVFSSRAGTKEHFEGTSTLVATNQRLLVTCQIFTKSKGFTATYKAVSAARAAMRRHGRVGIGAMRWEWVTHLSHTEGRVLASDTRWLGFGCLDDGQSISLNARSGAFTTDMAEWFVRLIADHRLKHTPDLSDSDRESLQAQATQPMISGQAHSAQRARLIADVDGRIYNLPGALDRDHTGPPRQ